MFDVQNLISFFKLFGLHFFLPVFLRLVIIPQEFLLVMETLNGMVRGSCYDTNKSTNNLVLFMIKTDEVQSLLIPSVLFVSNYWPVCHNVPSLMTCTDLI